MSWAKSEDLASTPVSSSAGSEHSSAQSLGGWTIPKLMPQPTCCGGVGMPYPATARKAELFRLLFPPPAAAGPGTQQASLQSIASALAQLHTMVDTLTTAVSDVQARVGVHEVRPAAPSLGAVTAPVIALPLTGTMDISPTIFPAHIVQAVIRKDILAGKDVNLASLLISVHDVAEKLCLGGHLSGSEVQGS